MEAIGALPQLLAALDRPRDVQTLLDCAAVAEQRGMDAEADLLLHIAFIHRGFGQEDRRWQSATALAYGVPGFDPVPAVISVPSSAIEAAVYELTDLASIAAHDPESERVMEVAPLSATDPLVARDEARTACKDLINALLQPFDANRLRSALHDVEAAGQKLGAIDARANAEDAQTLALGLAGVSLVRFIEIVASARFGPAGSLSMFHRLARAERHGLGAYFGNVANIIRHGRDIFWLISAAMGDDFGARFDDWAALIGTRLPDDLLIDLVDELADLHRLPAIQSIWTIKSRELECARGVALVIRDAALDLRDLNLATDAQRMAVSKNLFDPLDWMILGDIHINAGQPDSAELAYRSALKLAPRNEVINARRQAVLTGLHDHLAINRGFGHRSVLRSLQDSVKDGAKNI
ncbi:hypothetical protein FHS96_004584 [Sphingomonas zeicaulis]|uniref:hypothetical protein n=1 Tax=Sphingomonas zeicaulis TaxID=1632740 RepID=UPI003D20DAC3